MWYRYIKSGAKAVSDGEEGIQSLGTEDEEEEEESDSEDEGQRSPRTLKLIEKVG